MTTDADIQALATRFRWVRDKANVLIKSVPSLYASDVVARARPIVEIYHGAYYKFQNIVPDAKVGLDYFELSSVPKSGSGSEYQTFLDKLILNCKMALGYLEAITSPIPAKERDRLDSLRQQIESLEQFNKNLFRHVTTAIEEYEMAHYLASALLAGKVVVYVLEQLQGRTDEDKSNEIVKLGLLDEKMKPNFLKGARRARGYFTHDISAMPQPQDAISLVSDACDLSLKLMKTSQP